MFDIQTKKMREDEQQLMELFNLESSKLRILRNAQLQETEQRRQEEERMNQLKALENSTKKMNSIIARASKEDEEEESQVRIFK